MGWQLSRCDNSARATAGGTDVAKFALRLAMMSLAAKGTTQVNRIYHLDRGYEKMDEKFKKTRRADSARQGS